MDTNGLVKLLDSYGVKIVSGKYFRYFLDRKIIEIVSDNEYWEAALLHEAGHAINHTISEYHAQDEILAWEKAELLAKQFGLPWTSKVENFKLECLKKYKLHYIKGKWKYRGAFTRYHPAPITCTWLKYIM